MVVLKEVGFSADHANKCMKVLERDKHAHTRSRRWGASKNSTGAVLGVVYLTSST